MKNSLNAVSYTQTNCRKTATHDQINRKIQCFNRGKNQNSSTVTSVFRLLLLRARVPPPPNPPPHPLLGCSRDGDRGLCDKSGDRDLALADTIRGELVPFQLLLLRLLCPVAAVRPVVTDKFPEESMRVRSPSSSRILLE